LKEIGFPIDEDCSTRDGGSSKEQDGRYVDGDGNGGLYWSLYGDTLALSISGNPIYVYTVSLKGNNGMILSPICSEWSVLTRDDCSESSGEFKRLRFSKPLSTVPSTEMK